MYIYLKECLALLYFASLANSVNFLDPDDDDKADDPWGRCPWIRNRLKNGKVKMRSRGRVAKFSCLPGYDLVGKRYITCIRGQWNNPFPHCVANGCYKLPSPAKGWVSEMLRGAYLIYQCNPGYVIHGPENIYCDGQRWSDAPPICDIPAEVPPTFCDFEDPDLCGWSHDRSHDFAWRRNQFGTPSGHVGTGPSYDHTFGKGKGGFYLYLEASAPRKENDTCRIFSPVYPAHFSPGCFTFWYHMYGATTGGLRVYLKLENQIIGEIAPIWEKFGDQGNQWLSGKIIISQVSENFQLVIEGIRGSNYVGDTAIDDVVLWATDCNSAHLLNVTTVDTPHDSCRGRCREQNSDEQCECVDACVANNTCCSDYTKICSTGEESPTWDSETAPDFIVTDYINALSESHSTSKTWTDKLTTETLEISTSSEIPTTYSHARDETVPTTTIFQPGAHEIPTTFSTSILPSSLDITVTTPTTTTSTRNFPSSTTSLQTSSTTVFPLTSQTTVTTAAATRTTNSMAKTSTSVRTTKTSPITTKIPKTTRVVTETSRISVTEYRTTNIPIRTTTGKRKMRTTTEAELSTTPTATSTIATSTMSSPPTTFSTVYQRTSTRTIFSGRFPPTPKPTTKTTVITTKFTFPSTISTQKMTSTEMTPSTARSVIRTTSIPPSQETSGPSPQPRRITASTEMTTRLTTTPTTTPTTSRKAETQPTFKSTETVRKFGLQTDIPNSDTSIQSLPESSSSKSHGTTSRSMAGIAAGIVFGAALICVVAYFAYKRLLRKQNKHTDESEIRFLSENEALEFSNAEDLNFSS